jgi:L-threonylcarbamoyladenylate synthase
MAEPEIIPIGDPAAPMMAARAIAAGGVIAFPTDTVYGVGVDLWQPAAVARLYALKGRPQEKALPVLLADTEEWTRVACDAPEAALRLMRYFWPGALTIVLPRRPDVPDALAPLASTSALRVPAHEPLRRVLARTGPLATSSANRSGEPPASDAATVRAALGRATERERGPSPAGWRAALGAGLALLLDGGALPPSAPSTVVDVSGRQPTILRHGAIPDDAIWRVISG